RSGWARGGVRRRSAPGARRGVAREEGEAGPRGPARSPRKKATRASRRVVLERGALLAALRRAGLLAHRDEAPLVHRADDDLQAVAVPGERVLDLRRPQVLDAAL